MVFSLFSQRAEQARWRVRAGVRFDAQHYLGAEDIGSGRYVFVSYLV